MALKEGGTNSYTPLIQTFQTAGSVNTYDRNRANNVSMRVDSPTTKQASIKKKRKKRKKKIGLLYHK